jgi:flavin reductase (DIM6/NTAB) family NADH-FMN oxidoreductase RutF
MNRYTASDYQTIRMETLDSSAIRVLMGACIAPRPVALITTLGPGGIVNAAPYSNFMGVSSEPPLIAFAMGRNNGEEKDTLRNIRDNGTFVVNAVSLEMAEAMHHTAAEYPREVSELGPAGLTTVPGVATEVPRVAESPIHLECRVHQLVEIGSPPTNAIVIGEVLSIHARRDLVGEGPELNGLAWNPLGGIGDSYMRPGTIFDLPYPVPGE